MAPNTDSKARANVGRTGTIHKMPPEQDDAEGQDDSSETKWRV